MREKYQAGINLTDVCIGRVFCLFRCAGECYKIVGCVLSCNMERGSLVSALYFYFFMFVQKKIKKNKRDKREKEACVRNSTVVVLS